MQCNVHVKDRVPNEILSTAETTDCRITAAIERLACKFDKRRKKERHEVTQRSSRIAMNEIKNEEKKMHTETSLIVLRFLSLFIRLANAFLCFAFATSIFSS